MTCIVWMRNCSALEISAPARDFIGARSRFIGVERRRAEIRIHAHHVRAQFTRDSSEFGHDGLGVVDQRFVAAERDDAHLVRREPEREVARV